MIYVTGDMHGDFSRFKRGNMRKLRKNDILIVCGDFGFIWDGSAREHRLLRRIGKLRFQVLFVEGAHDNMGLLREYPVSEWNGGSVREISGHLRQLLRGEIYNIEGKTVFAFGGGEDEDSDLHRELPGWVDGGLPTPDELERARSKLAAHNHRVDYIVTHQPSGRIRQFLSMDWGEPNVLDSFLDEIRETCTYRRWFFGQIHKNKRIPPSELALFQAVAAADAEL